MYFLFDIYNTIKAKLKEKLFPADPTPAHLRAWPFPVGQVPATKPKRGRPCKKPEGATKKRTAIKAPKKAK